MPFNVPEDQKPEFNKKVKGSLELLTAGVTDKLRKIELESADTLVEAYNQPVSEAELTQVPPSDMVTVDPQMARRIEINSLRMPDGTIYRNANELFSKPVDFNQFQAIGFVDKEGNATPNGELFFNLKEAGMFNEDGTLTKKGQAYSMSERDLEDEANLDAFETLWKDGVIRPSATWDEQLEAAAGFVGNAFVGFTDLMQTFGKSISVKNAFDVLTGTPEGKKLEAEFQTSGLAAIEKITTNFANLGRLADVGAAALADTIQQEDVAMIGPGGVPMYTQSVEALQQQNAEAERDLYAARQRQWKQNRDIQSFEVGQIAETVLGLDGAVKMAEDARNTLGAEEFNKRYSRVGAFSELAFDPTNLIPASVAFNVAKSVPIASRLTLGAQKMLGRVAQTEAELAKVQAVVQAGNAVLKKEELFVPRYQQLFKNMSAKAADNPELMVRANEVLDRAKQITASADEVRAAMPTAMNTLEELTVKRNSLATRIPEAYANKVMQTVELGRRIRSAPARTLSSMLERTGNTLTKVDDAVTTYLKDRGLDQAYNAALGASGVVGLAGNPVVGAIGVTGAALKSGKFLTEYGKILRYVGKEMENARGQIPFWKRVAAHTAPGSLGRGIAHTFNIFELGGATSDIIRRAGRGVAAAYPTDLFFEWLSDGADMRPQTMTQAAAESLVIGGSFAAAGGAFMGTNKRMRELSIGDEINFRQGLTDTKQKALYESLPPGVRRSMATYSIANPTLNYNFIDSGTSGYDINTNTANINVNSSNPLKALVAHETLHHTLIKNNMEGGIAALFLGDTKANAVGGLFRSKDGKLDPDFEKFKDGYYKRLRDAGMTDAEIGIEYPLDKIAVEYFIEQHADQYATMAETGELGALAARGEVRKKLGAVLETVLPKIPVLRDLHIKSGGAIDANGAWVKGNGILGDDKIRQNPIANRMFREMNRRSSGMMPGQFEPLISDKEGSGAPLMFDPANAIDMELMHPFIQMDENDKPILKDGRPVFIDKSVDIDRAMAGLTAMEAMRKRRESNYAPEKGEAYIDDDGELQPGWLSDAVLNEIFAKHKFNNEQKRMIRQTNKLIKQGQGQRMVMINFPATTRLKSGKVVYAPQKAAIRDAVPVAMTISKDGNILYGLMSVTKLQENIKKRAQSKRGKKLYAGNVDAILQDVQAMMDFHLNRPTEDSIVHFNEKYGVVEGDQRKKFINTMFGLLNKKEQAVLNPMLLEDGVKSADNVYRTYRADRVSKAIPMAPEEYAAMPFSYEAVSQVRMPEAQRAMPEGISPEDLNPVANKQEAQGLWADGKQMFAINEMDEKLTPITSKAMLDSYPADAIGWMEPEQATAPSPTRFMPEGVDEDKFYSQLDRVITDKVPSRATPQQIMATIDPTRGSGVKAEEIKWSGIEQALASLEKDGKVSKEELLNYLRNEGRVRFEEFDVGKAFQPQDLERMRQEAERSGDFSRYDEALLQNLHDGTKYAQYQLPGGENYREVVLAMPTQGEKRTPNQIAQAKYGKDFYDLTRDQMEEINSEMQKNLRGTDASYTSPHFPDIPNYVAHMRTNERVDANGRPGLFVEEFQSDRHQEGRKKGYREDNKEAQMLQEYLDAKGKKRIDLERSLKTQYPEWKQQYSKFESFAKNKQSLIQNQQSGRVADAPFRTTWPLQLFKRALRDAVDSGKEWVGWTTGETQAERFDLSKQIGKVVWNEDTKMLNAYDPSQQRTVIQESNITADKLEDYVGKEVAKKLVDQSPDEDMDRSLAGLDLRVGGEGMKGFYDNMLPKEIGKYVKPFGGGVEKTTIIDPKGGRDISFQTKDQAEKWASDPVNTGDHETAVREDVDGKWIVWDDFSKRYYTEGKSVPIWKVSITPEMRQLAQGQMRFMPEGERKTQPIKQWNPNPIVATNKTARAKGISERITDELFELIKNKPIVVGMADLLGAGGKIRGVDVSGGPGYPIQNFDPANPDAITGVWASERGGINTILQNMVKTDSIWQDESGHNWALFAPHTMAQSAHKSNAQTPEIYISKVNDMAISGALKKATAIDLSDHIRANVPMAKDMPNIGTEKLTKFIHDAAFETRAAIMSELSNVRSRDLGAPSPETILTESRDPQYHGVEKNALTGLLLIDVDRLATKDENGNWKLRNDLSADDFNVPKHPSYGTVMPGRVLVHFDNPVPFRISTPEMINTMRAASPLSRIDYLLARMPKDKGIKFQPLTDQIKNAINEAQNISGNVPYIREAVKAVNGNWRKFTSGASLKGLSELIGAIHRSPARDSLTQYTLSDLQKMIKEDKMEVHQLGDNDIWFGVKKSKDGNELVSVVNNTGIPGMLNLIMQRALEVGVNKLDAYAVPTQKTPNGLLPSLYKRYGWKEVERVPFDRQYLIERKKGEKKSDHEAKIAQKEAALKMFWTEQGWDGQSNPDVVFMTYEKGRKTEITSGESEGSLVRQRVAESGTASEATSGEVRGAGLVGGREQAPVGGPTQGDSGTSEGVLPRGFDSIVQSLRSASPIQIETIGITDAERKQFLKKLGVE